MNCPRCKETILSVTYRTGIEIDFCPVCRGVWLDRGELDKVIERSELERAGESRSRRSEKQISGRFDSEDHRRDSDESGRYRKDSPRRRSWFSELFD